MSIMTCTRCDRYIDTDYDVEGEFRDTGFICALCIENEDLRDELDEANFHRHRGDYYSRMASTSPLREFWLAKASISYALASVIIVSIKDEGNG